MGNTESSSAILETPLFPIDKRVASLSVNHCSAAPVTLHLHRKPWRWMRTAYVVRHAFSRQEVFRIDGSTLSKNDHKTLVDATNDQILGHVRQAYLTSHRQLRICADREGRQRLFAITSISSQEAVVEFSNVVNYAERIRVGMYGDWRAAIVWIDQGNGQELPVARICRCKSSQDFYSLDVAPNMDQAIVVLCCVVLDQLKKDSEAAMILPVA